MKVRRSKHHVIIVIIYRLMIHKREKSLSVCVQKQQEERYLRNQRELIKKQFLNDQRIEK